MTRYYLDTTAHIERHAGDEQRRTEIESRLAEGTGHTTSTHVQREWRSIVEGATVDVLNLLQDSNATLSTVFAGLSQGYGRSQGQRLRVLAMLAGQNVSIDPSMLQLRAQTFLRSTAEELFRAGLGEIRDGSECGLARREVSIDNKGRRSLDMQCRKAECVCRQPEFLEDNRPGIDQVASDLQNASGSQNDSLRRLGGKVREAMDADPGDDRKGSLCWRYVGGDPSIALECAADEVLLTTDRSFDFICPALGIRHERISATPPP